MYSRWLPLATLLLIPTSAWPQPPTFTRTDVASIDGARGLASADFDENGWMDLAHANGSRNSVTVLLNTNGVFTRTIDAPAGAGPFGIATADFNRDGHADLA